jgi:hypothetical protein
LNGCHLVLDKESMPAGYWQQHTPAISYAVVALVILLHS